MAAFVQLVFCTFAVLFVLVMVANVHLGGDHSDTESHKVILGVGCAFAVSLMVAELFCCKNPSYGYLSHMMLDAGAYQHVECVRQAAPQVDWSIQCYHYKTEHYTTTTRDSNGNTRTEHHTRQVRVNTHSARMKYLLHTTIISRSSGELSVFVNWHK